MSSPLIGDDARIFLAIARTGTLSGTSTLLGMGIATVSRRLDRIEAALGITLFSRHQFGYRLTDDGEMLLQRAEALEQAGQAFSSAGSQQRSVSGVVRLATAENLANTLIVPSLSGLFEQHPGLRVDVVGASQTVNLHRRDADLAVRMVRPENGNLIIRQLATLGYGLYGAAAYLDARRTDGDSARFDHDAFIGWSETHQHLPAAQWLKRTLYGRPCRLQTNALSSQVAAACAGLGLAVLPHLLARPAGLVCLQSELGIDQPIWLAIHADLAHSRRVRAVADHLIALFEQQQPALAALSN